MEIKRSVSYYIYLLLTVLFLCLTFTYFNIYFVDVCCMLVIFGFFNCDVVVQVYHVYCLLLLDMQQYYFSCDVHLMLDGIGFFTDYFQFIRKVFEF